MSIKITKSFREFSNSQQRLEYIESIIGAKLPNIANTMVSETEIQGANIENFIGATQIPLGIAGPLKIQNTKSEIRDTLLPLATTEGALVASVSRGCKAIAESEGATVSVEDIGVTRGPVFKTSGVKHNFEIKKWIDANFDKLDQVCRQTSTHLSLTRTDVAYTGRNLYVRFYFNTDNAMGMNMATIATEKAVELIEKETKAKCISVAGNFDIDKKPAWLNFINGRGKKVWAEAIISGQIVQNILKTSPEKIVELVQRKILTGSIMAGSLGFNAHYANIIAAIFAATGQDLGQVAEGSLGITSAEVLENGDLYFSIYLPSLMVGTIGGGTKLPTQKEALTIIGATSVLEFAEVIGAAVLAGELSLLASQAEGSLVKAHVKLGRKGKK